MTQTVAPTPSNPAVFRLGKVEKRFRAFAEKLGTDPGELLVQLLEEGVTQSQLSDTLKCTRQAVGVLAKRYGCGFQGARLDLDEVAQKVSGATSLKDYVVKFWPTMTQAQMSAELGISLSTMKRRIKALGMQTKFGPGAK